MAGCTTLSLTAAFFSARCFPGEGGSQKGSVLFFLHFANLLARSGMSWAISHYNAAKMGFETMAIARGKVREPYDRPTDRQLRARHFTDSQGTDPAAELNKLGGASVIIATVTNGDAMAAVLGGLAPRGTLMVIGASGPIPVNPILLIRGKTSVKGWYSGTSIDSQDTLKFSSAAGVQSMNEVFPLERAAAAYDRMMSGEARFRVVLDLAGKG